MSPQLPKTYKAAQIDTKGGDFKIIDKPLVLPQAGQVLVKVLACGVCHSDSIVKEEIFPVLPKVPGHEIVGTVVAIPDSEKLWKVGQRVGSGWHGGHDSTCDSCRSGDFVTCSNENINGIFTDGGYAEYVLLRTEAIASIPEDIDPAEAAPLLCAGITTFNSLRNMDVHPGDIVGVQGLGGLGHLAVQYAAAMGFRVAVLSSSASKQQLATSLGAHEYIDGSQGDQGQALQKLGGAKVIICTAPSAQAIKSLVGGLRAGGTLLILAIAAEDIPISSGAIVTKRLKIQGWPSGTAKDSEDTVAFSILKGVKCQVERYPLDKVAEAYDSMITGKARFRAVIVFDK